MKWMKSEEVKEPGWYLCIQYKEPQAIKVHQSLYDIKGFLKKGTLYVYNTQVICVKDLPKTVKFFGPIELPKY